MGNAAASGGYWIAMDANRIVAQPGTLTGSIGVIAGKPIIATLSEKLGIRWERIERGTNSDLWSISEPFDEGGRVRVEAMIDKIYGRFKEGVARGRGLDPERVEEIAQGRVWTGERALELGLVDRLGGIPEALEEARLALDLEADAPITVRYWPSPRDPVEVLAELVQEDLDLFGQARLIWNAISSPVVARMPWLLIH